MEGVGARGGRGLGEREPKAEVNLSLSHLALPHLLPPPHPTPTAHSHNIPHGVPQPQETQSSQQSRHSQPNQPRRDPAPHSKGARPAHSHSVPHDVAQLLWLGVLVGQREHLAGAGLEHHCPHKHVAHGGHANLCGTWVLREEMGKLCKVAMLVRGIGRKGGGGWAG